MTMFKLLAASLVFTLLCWSPARAQVAPQPAREAEPMPSPVAQPDYTNPRRPFSLMVGDPAPALNLTRWILGEPVDAIEAGKVYVIFLWSVWDQNAISIMPRLSELQNQHPEKLVVIGATSPGKVNTREAAEKFVFESGVPVLFHVAWDYQRLIMDNWLNIAGRSGVPCIFIVDQEKRLAYIGGVAEYEQTLKQVMEETFDIELATRQYVECITATWAYTHYEKYVRDRDWPQAQALGREIVLSRGINCFSVLNNVAWLNVDPARPIDHPDLDLALMAAQRADELVNGTDADTIDTIARVYSLKGDYQRAVEFQERAVKVARSEALRAPLAKTLEEYRAMMKPIETRP